MGLRAGIDLGTTNSCIYVALDDEVILIVHRFDARVVPSAVWQSAGKLVVGRAARARIGSRPAPILELKRLMETDKRVDLDGEPRSAVEVSALILRHLKEAAEAFMREELARRGCPERFAPVTDVVITHPAYFSAVATAATARAGTLAGFDTVALLPEPIAAALAYVRRLGDAAGDRRILCFDLGGGTFDVTVLERRDRERAVDVLAHGGDRWLGGSNYDRALADVLRRHLVQQGYALDPLDPDDPGDAARIQRLRAEAETVKIGLTREDVVSHVKPEALVDRAGNLVDIAFTISRGQFNELTRPLTDRALDLTHRLLAMQSFADGRRLSAEEVADLPPDTVRARSRANARFCDVIMVGSSCWMPVIGERLSEELGRPAHLESPDVIVAEGAALYAGRTSDGPSAIVPTTARGVDVRLHVPARIGRTKQVPIKGELSGPCAGFSVVLIDMETGRANRRPLAGPGPFLFLQDIRKDGPHEFVLRLLGPDDAEVLEHGFTVTFEPRPPGGDHVAPGIALPILVLTQDGFRSVLPAGARLPAKTERPVRLLTPDASGTCRVPFYEAEVFQAELAVRDAPPRENVPLLLTAAMDERYRVTASVLVEGATAPLPLEFSLQPRPVRTADEILAYVDRLRKRFEDGLVNVQNRRRTLRFRGELQGLERLLAEELASLDPEPARLEDLAARFRRLVDEVSALPRLVPSIDGLRDEMDEARRREAATDNQRQTIGELLEQAAVVWEAQDENRWTEIVAQCRELAATIRPDPIPPPPTPEEVKASDLAALAEWPGKIGTWPPDAAAARDALLGQIAETERKLEAASGPQVYVIHNTEVVPLFHRVQAGPPGPPKPPKSGEGV